MKNLKPGARCTLTGAEDLYMDEDARPFIGKPCIIVQRCKSGLIQVALQSKPKKLYEAPARNVELTDPSSDV